MAKFGRVGFIAAMVIACAPFQASAQTTEPVRLAAHRAVYDLSLLSSRGVKGVDAAKGRIVYELTGNACDGYALNFRQVTQIESNEIGVRVSDFRSSTFESGDGLSFRFKSDSRSSGGPEESGQGRAMLSPSGALQVEFTAPKREALSHDGPVLFPSAHTKRVVEMARAGERILEAKIFDGGEQGRKIYDTLSVIGARIEPGSTAGVEAAARTPELAKLPSWPLTISYFDAGDGERTPLYVISFVMFDNGVSCSLRIDYGDFTLKGDLTKLESLDPGPCDR